MKYKYSIFKGNRLMRFLVDFLNSATDSEIQNYLVQHNCTVIKEWENFDKIFLVETASTPPNTSITERVSEENSFKIKPLDVINVNPYYGTHSDPNNETITVNVTDSKDWWKNYCYAQPEFNNNTMQLSRLGKNVDVYIMDSGIEATHPEFVETNIVNIYSVTGEFSDTNGHGTAIASVISGKTCGITNATLKIVKIFSNSHETTEHEFLDAIDAIINDHEDNSFSVLNCSWSIPKNEWVEHKLRVLEDEGVFIIAASGNSGTEIEDVTPAGMLDVITVGAYNQNLNPCNFSNYTGIISTTGNAVNHGELDGWAPGENIYAASLNGGYGFCAGTSIAAGITSAVLASNIHWYINDSQQRTKGFENLRISTSVLNSRNFLFARPNLLDFQNNEKYSNSANIIATLRDRNTFANVTPPDEFFISTRVGQAGTLVRIYEPTTTKSIELIDQLPANFDILPDGRLYAGANIQGPTESESYITKICKVKRTTLDGVEETLTLNINILGENATPSTLPSDDPIQITLLMQYCTDPPLVSCSVQPEPVTSCVDTCSFSCCNPGAGKGDVACTCI